MINRTQIMWNDNSERLRIETCYRTLVSFKDSDRKVYLRGRVTCWEFIETDGETDIIIHTERP